MKTFVLATCCALLAVQISASCAPASKGVDDFESIRQLVCQGQYRQALPKLQAYNGKYNSRASLFIGKAYLGLGDYGKARNAFEVTVKRYPKTLESHKAKYKLAIISFLENDPTTAKARFQEIADNPDGPLSPEAAAFARFLP